MICDIQRAPMGKRISAFLFDVILFACIAVGCIWALSAVFQYGSYEEKMESHYEKYEKEYGIDLEIKEKDYEALSEEEKGQYQKANEAFQKDAEVAHTYQMMFSLSVTFVSLGTFLAYFIWEFLIPLFLKNGQTFGKKIFGLAVIRIDGVKASNVQLFIRAILGKYAVETMVPILLFMMLFFNFIGIVGLIVLFGLLILQGCLFFFTKTRTPIHDLFAATVTVDYSTQMIFDSKEDLISYKEKLAKEKAESLPY